MCITLINLLMFRLSQSGNDDCVALRTRNRHPETSYVELPTSTRHLKEPQKLAIPKITVSRSIQKVSNCGRGTPDSVIVIG
jgi:hypothetical protein